MYKTREITLPRPGNITYKHIYFQTGLGSNFCRQKQKPKTFLVWQFYMRTKFYYDFLLFPCIKQVLATFFCYQLAYPPEGQWGHLSGGSAPFVERDPRRYYWAITHLLDQLFCVLVVSCQRSYFLGPQNSLRVDCELWGCRTRTAPMPSSFVLPFLPVLLTQESQLPVCNGDWSRHEFPPQRQR